MMQVPLGPATKPMSRTAMFMTLRRVALHFTLATFKSDLPLMISAFPLYRALTLRRLSALRAWLRWSVCRPRVCNFPWCRTSCRGWARILASRGYPRQKTSCCFFCGLLRSRHKPFEAWNVVAGSLLSKLFHGCFSRIMMRCWNCQRTKDRIADGK